MLGIGSVSHEPLRSDEMTRFGVHSGLQHTTVDDLRSLWRRVEDLGFDWISIWDHFYGATGLPDDAECFEAVAMHTALALETTRVECGSLVYSIGYRHPAVLAKAITAIDHLSGGRAAMGLGAGWAEVEYKAYGIEYPTYRHSHGPARGGRRGAPRPAPRRGHELLGASGSRRPTPATNPARCRRSCRSGSAARARSAR